jgi:hypothetical protein
MNQSNIANKVDPRVDSTTGAHTIGSSTTNNGVGHTGVGHNGVGNGVGHNTGAYDGTTGGYSSSNTGAGPHSSNLANKVDPRVDSATGAHTIGSSTNGGTTGTYRHSGNTMGNTGTVGGISNSSNAGPHNSNLANKVDPTVDSDLSGRGNNHGAVHGGLMGSGTHATPGSGTAQNTAGPHNSDMMNKLDPRVE